MLQLKQIVKTYGSGENVVHALNGVSITFRKNEFVAILGHSGCGKTTMLNIIGGLDHYTSGDLIINGVSTKQYKSRDWDAYRNHSIGFVFQSYNLIPHQSVLANVELALTISGVSKAERRKRAKEALEKVGLGNQLNKKPNQMSGGQMQRVAIARALINDPDILLADEPTGALDSETSIQVMELLKEIAKDKLVIMVTHNPELAEDYANRIVKVKDGKITNDSNPYKAEEAEPEKSSDKKRVSMSFGTAVALSMNNLLTKKGRTVLTAFAGSIGIIGIALILSLSSGINKYINDIQEETLSSYPLEITRENADTAKIVETMMKSKQEYDKKEFKDDHVYSNTLVYEMFNSMNSSAKQINNMKDFKSFLDEDEDISKYTTSIGCSYDVKMPIFTEAPSGSIMKVDFMDLYMNAFGVGGNQMMNTGMMGAASNAQMSMMGLNVFTEMLPKEDGTGVSDILTNQYELVSGRWPESYDEVVMFLANNNEIPDFIAFSIGLKDPEDFTKNLKTVMDGKTIEDYGACEWTLDEIMNKKFKMVLPCEYYQQIEGQKGCNDLTSTESGLDFLFNTDDVGTEIKIVGFVRPGEDVKAPMVNSYIGYTAELTKYVIEKTNDSELVKAQVSDEKNDLITGTVFKTDDYVEPSAAEKAAEAKAYIKNSDTAKKAEIYRFIMSQPDPAQLDAQISQMMKDFDRNTFMQQISDNYAKELGVDASQIQSYIGGMDDAQLKEFAEQAAREQMTAQYAETVQQQLAAMTNDDLAKALDAQEFKDDILALVCDAFTPQEISSSNYEQNLTLLGKADLSDPSTIRLYTKSFEDKDKIADIIKDYNKDKDEADIIRYTDVVALLMSSITSIISGISYLLIAFVGISLVVSSIMIGIITYISVLERTREIGILRAIGASKHDVSTVFNAETLLIGLCAGLIGIGTTVLLCIPINLIIHSITSLDTLYARLPIAGGIILVCISMFLTFIAGLIPSGVAARKDPVEALRTE